MTSCFAAKSKSTPYNVKVTSAGLQPMLQEMRWEVNKWAAKLLLHDGLEHSQYQCAGWGDTVQYNTMYAFRRVVPPCRERQRLLSVGALQACRYFTTKTWVQSATPELWCHPL
jgi:hypothetical protein